MTSPGCARCWATSGRRAGDHHVDPQAALLRAPGITLDVPVAVGPRPLPQQLDMAADRLEGHDQPFIQHLVTQEVVVLADIGADIENAVYFKSRHEFAQMQ